VAFLIRGNRPQTQDAILTYIASGFAVLAVLFRLVLPLIIVAQGRRSILRSAEVCASEQECEKRLAALLMSKTIMAVAVLESAVLFSLVAFAVEGTMLSLAIAGCLLIAMAMHFPTHSMVTAWIEDQQQKIKEAQIFNR
jgi:hypothetical protein